MVADGTSIVERGRNTLVVADTSISATVIPLVQMIGDPGEVAGGAAVSYIIKDAGVGFTLGMSNAVQKDSTMVYKRVTRTGTGTIPNGKSQLYVAYPSTGATSVIAIVMTAKTGAVVESVLKNPGYGFTIVLSSAVEKDITFDYYVTTRTGTADFVAGREKVEVTDAGFTAEDNVIIVSPNSDLGSAAGGAVVEWVDTSNAVAATPTTVFTVNLRDVSEHSAAFDYLVL